MVQQLNRSLKAMDRRTTGYELVQLNDFKETSDTTDGAEVVLALYYPHREKIAKVDGYPIKDILKYRFRLIQVINFFHIKFLTIFIAFNSNIILIFIHILTLKICVK